LVVLLLTLFTLGTFDDFALILFTLFAFPVDLAFFKKRLEALKDFALPADFTLFVFGTFEDLFLADLALDDLINFLLPDFRLFKKRVVVSLNEECALTLLLATDFEDFNDLILGTFDDFALILLAFLTFTDLLVTFKLFADFTLSDEYTEESDKKAMAIKAMIDVYLLDMII